MPLPELPPLPPNSEESFSRPVESPTLHLSALDSYTGKPGALPGTAFWPRVAARVIDAIVHNIIALGSGAMFGFLFAVAATLRHDPGALALLHRKGGTFTVFLFSLLGMIALETVGEGLHGSTPGKMVLGLVVVQEDGTPCRFGSALIRSLAYFVDALFFGLIGYFSMQKSPERQRHGDEWAHTIVCRRSEVSPQNLRGLGQFVMVFLIAAMADAALLMVAVMTKTLG